MNNVLTLKNNDWINDVFGGMNYGKPTYSNYKMTNSRNENTDYIYPAKILLDKTYSKNYVFKTSMELLVYIHNDKSITCYDDRTSIYGVGETLEESKKDFMDSFLDYHNFLKNNKDSISKIDIDNLVYINKLIQES